MNPTPDFKIVLLHDNPVSGLRGTSILARLAGKMTGEDEKMNTETWKFEVLLQPALRERAASRMREANMIVISADGGSELPEHIKIWMENTLSERQNREAAIVALLNWESVMSRELPRLGSYLQELAVKSGLDFFCNHDAWRPRQEPVNPPAVSGGEDHWGASRDLVPQDTGGQGWGIND
jgi:hypothetical protein